MKKNLIITMTFALFLLSCKKADTAPDTQAAATFTTGPVTIAPVHPTTCENYSIANTQRPSGTTLTYEYDDCGEHIEMAPLHHYKTLLYLPFQGQ